VQKRCLWLADFWPGSTSVAGALGESTGATSYHLRKLAEQHLIEEVPERSGGRERRCRSST
jgi:DNA-binding transcriptional ArsR family regulator